MIEDIDRPDVNGAAPKMQAVMESVKKTLAEMDIFLKVTTDDNIMSSVWVTGTLDPEENWNGRIFENSRYFRFSITPAKGARYYNEGENVTVELVGKSYNLDKKFRKSTTTPEKAAERIRKWIAEL